MKILIIRPNTANFGKVGSYNVQEVGLAKQLIQKGHVVEIYFLHKKVKKVEVDLNVNYVKYIPHIRIGLHGIFSLSHLSKFNPDLIILFSDNQFWSKNIILWAKKAKIKVLNYFGNVLSDNPNLLNQLYTYFILLRNFNSYKYSINVAKNKKALSEFKKFKIPNNGLIHVGLDATLMNNDDVDISYHRKILGIEKNDFVLLFVGRLINYKNPFFALILLKKLNEIRGNFRLIFIGDGPLRKELVFLSNKFNLSKQIIILSNIKNSEMHLYYKLSNCFLNFSKKEIFGMAILEAMYYGLPTIAHIAPGPREIIFDKVDGLLIDSLNIDSWVDGIMFVMNNRFISENGKSKVINNFIWNKLYMKFLDKL